MRPSDDGRFGSTMDPPARRTTETRGLCTAARAGVNQNLLRSGRTFAVESPPTMSPEPELFLHVPSLLERSIPKPRPAWVWYGMIAFAVVVLTVTGAAGQNPQLKLAVRFAGGLAMLGLVA